MASPAALSRRGWNRVAVLAVLLLAYALRAYGVGASAFRGDEGFSVGISAKPVSQILTLMQESEPNPPLHLLLLKVWRQVAGSSELAMRWPSVLAGLAAVALTYRLGLRLVGVWPARVGALLLAFSPLLIWYSQDARVYALLTALVLAAVWQTWEAARRNRWRNWLAAGGLWWLALFAHYFAALPLVAVGLALVLAPQTRRRWFPALAMALGVGLAQLPWGLFVAPMLIGHSKNWIVPTTVGEAMWRALAAFGAGTTAQGALPLTQWVGGGLLTALAGLGLWAVARRNPTEAIWLAALGLGAPVLLGLLSLFRPVFTEQYAIPALPGILLLGAAGLGAAGLAAGEKAPAGRAGRWLLPVGAGSVLAGVALLALANYFFNPHYAKSPDWHTVVDYLKRTERPAEVVALNLPDPAFYFYYDGKMPVEAVPPGPLAQVGQPAAEAQLQRLRDRFDHVRFFFSPSPNYDPDGFAERWLQTCCEQMADTFVAGFRVQTFDTPSGSLAARQAYAVNFADGVTLTGYRATPTEAAAGDTVHLTLFWTARAPVQQAYTVFVHFLAADGFDLQDADGPPAEGRRPTDGWAVNESIIDAHLVQIPEGTSPGAYGLEIGLYLPATGERLSGMDGAGQTVNALRLPLTLTVRTP